MVSDLVVGDGLNGWRRVTERSTSDGERGCWVTQTDTRRSAVAHCVLNIQTSLQQCLAFRLNKASPRPRQTTAYLLVGFISFKSESDTPARYGSEMEDIVSPTPI